MQRVILNWLLSFALSQVPNGKSFNYALFMKFSFSLEVYSLKVLKDNGVLNRAGRALDVMAGIYKMMHRPEWIHEHKHTG